MPSIIFDVEVRDAQLHALAAESKAVAKELDRTGQVAQAIKVRGFGKEFQTEVRRSKEILLEVAKAYEKVAAASDLRGSNLKGLGVPSSVIEQVRKANIGQFVGKEETLKALQGFARGIQSEVRAFSGRMQQINQEFVRQFISTLRPLEGALVGALRGFGHRFRATFQFAISGAVIFAFQRLVREAFDTAVEVERAFADIATALEFDVPFDRGSADFVQALERVRVEALAIADELNELPTVVNRIAFQMVARFRDTDNAIAATRAQILALKVSTIDADEILRALTATAEAFAISTLSVNTNLSLQEQVLARENAAVGIYTKALDLATQIQQEWGISLEDTIEGVGRSAESFQQAGFTMEETAAVIASVVFTLGLTGSQVAEKLNRSLVQITTPQIRDDLLDLAAASEALVLTFDDFDTGSKALETITDQFQSIQDLEPGTALRIAQIIGQRRETEVVTAVLARGNFRESIVQSAEDAAGTAERRFSFLEKTLSEILKSIASQFQELVQNLERLGAVSPIKLLLSTVDALFDTFNAVLRTVNALVVALAKIPGVGLLIRNNLLPHVLALIVAFRIAKRTMIALSTVANFAATAKLAAKAAVASSAVQIGGGAAIAAGAGSAAVAATAASYLRLNLLLGKFGRLVFGIIGPFGRFGAEMKQLTFVTTALTLTSIKLAATRAFETGVGGIRGIGALLKGGGGATGIAAGTAAGVQALAIVGIVGGLIFSLNQFVQAIKQANRGMEDFRETLEELNTSTDRRVALGELSPLDERIQRARNEIAAVQGQEPLSTRRASFFNTFTAGPIFEAIGRKLNREFDEILSDPAEVDRLLDLAGVGDTVADRVFERNFPTRGRNVIIPLSAANIEATEARLFQDDLAPALLEKFDKDIREFSIGLGDELTSNLLKRLGELNTELRNAVTSGEVQLVEELFDEFAIQVGNVVAAAGLTLEGLEITLNTARKDFERIQRDLSFGRISTSEADSGFRKLRDQLLQQATFLRAQTENVDAQLLADDFEKQADTVLKAWSAAIIAFFDKRQSLADVLLTEENALRASLRGLKTKLALLEVLGEKELAAETAIDVIRGEAALIIFYEAEAQAANDLVQQFAKTRDERIASQEKLIKALRLLTFQAAFGGNPQLTALMAAALREAQATDERMIEDLKRTELVAAVREQGPLLARLTAIRAELAGLRFDQLFLDDGSVELVIAQNEIAVLVANAAQELLREAASAALLLAGANNSILTLKAQISITAAEMELTAKLYGDQSAELNELKLKQEQFKNQLAATFLELRDLNRRLDSDITDAFAQAQLDLVAVLEKLAAPDLGDVERARLKIEKQNAEAIAKKSFFDKQLFLLQFASETGALGTSAYIGALEALLAEVDTTTEQGKRIFLQIQGVIDGLTGELNNLAFNIPTSIRLPTLFEIRRSLAADQLGVNYQDNRVQEINVYVSDDVDILKVMDAIESTYGGAIDLEAQRLAGGGSRLTIGSF